MGDDTLGFIHRFVPAPGVPAAQAPTLLLLHGTGGDETDLLGLGRLLAPDASLLSPRGKVLERGMPRFFRRLAEGVFDEADLVRRTHELARFVAAAAARYGFDARHVIAVGFSNGANIAASLLLLHPDVLAGAALLHAMVPLAPPQLPISERPISERPISERPHLAGVPVFLGAGRLDPIARPDETEQLAALLGARGARVTVAWQPGGHTLSQAEALAARDWLAASGLLAPTAPDGEA